MSRMSRAMCGWLGVFVLAALLVLPGSYVASQEGTRRQERGGERGGPAASEERERGERPSERGAAEQELEILRRALPALRETERREAIELLERAIQARQVALEGRQQIPVRDEATMETNVPGLFVAGTAAGGTQERFTYFISTCHDHVAKIVRAMTGRVPQRLGTIPARNNAVTYSEVKAN